MQNSIIDDAKQILYSLNGCLKGLTQEEFTCPIAIIGNSSIGHHTRHILNFFKGLLSAYDHGIVNYDNRDRNILLETDRDIVNETINGIVSRLNKQDKILMLATNNWNNNFAITTNYYRELYYCTEHGIHHQALIRVGIMSLGIEISLEDFGVARSTMKHRGSLNIND